MVPGLPASSDSLATCLCLRIPLKQRLPKESSPLFIKSHFKNLGIVRNYIKITTT